MTRQPSVKTIKRLVALTFLIFSSFSFGSETGAGKAEPVARNKEPINKTAANKAPNKTGYSVEEITTLPGVPWGMVFLNDHTLLYTLRDGAFGSLDIRTGLSLPVSVGARSTRAGVRGQVWARGQGGLLDIAIPPGPLFEQQPTWIYFTYSKNSKDQGVTTLARAKLQPGEDSQLELTAWQDLLVTESATDTTRHFGSRIAFDGNGHVFFTVGDRGHRPNGQDLSTHAGSVLRLNLDGSVPTDNPFVEPSSDTPDALPEIWSYGHRNPQGIFYDHKNDRLWLNEHGPRGGDEINLVIKGKNYGWPVVSHGKEYWGPLAVGEATSKPGMEDPKKVYIPSIAPSSLLLYTGDAFPGWRGNLFSGALKLTHLNRVIVDDTGNIVGEERLLQEWKERIRHVIQSPGGGIIVSTDSGKILHLKPS